MVRKKKLTSKQYVAREGKQCPICHTKNIIDEDYDIEDDVVLLYVHCLDCDTTWTDKFKLIGYKELEEGSGVGDDDSF
jgi:hypothetical protein